MMKTRETKYSGSLQSFRAPQPLVLVGALAILLLGVGCDHEITVLEQHEIDTGFATSMTSSSIYLEMADGVRIAMDVHVPQNVPGVDRFPALIELTRYWRSRGQDLPYTVRRAVERGYAYIIVDERGTGASFGEWALPLQERALEDGREIIDWIWISHGPTVWWELRASRTRVWPLSSWRPWGIPR